MEKRARMRKMGGKKKTKQQQEETVDLITNGWHMLVSFYQKRKKKSLVCPFHLPTGFSLGILRDL